MFPAAARASPKRARQRWVTGATKCRNRTADPAPRLALASLSVSTTEQNACARRLSRQAGPPCWVTAAAAPAAGTITRHAAAARDGEVAPSRQPSIIVCVAPIYRPAAPFPPVWYIRRHRRPALAPPVLARRTPAVFTMSNPESETWSLQSFANETVEINGRLYQQWSLDKGVSHTPIDEDERERLDRMHNLFQMIFDNRLIFPPVSNPRKILDCGFGSAAWPIAVAEKYPNCEVIGVDISPHMKPDEIPENLWLQIDDLNEPFTFPSNEFDVVHSQHVVLGINKRRWPSYVRDCVRVLKPGGWFQSVEIYFNFQSDNGTLTEEHALRQLSDTHMRALEDIKDLRAPLRMNSMMSHAGLVELGDRTIVLPLSAWPTDPRNRAIGASWTNIFKQALTGHLQIPVMENLGMSIDELHVLVARARADLDDLSLKPYVSLYVHIGRKPLS